MVRRAAAIGIGLVVVLLLVFGIRGCLNGAKEQALKDYNGKVSGVIQDANSNAEEFFGTLAGGGSTTSDAASTDIQSSINQLRLRAQGLTKRAQALDVPGDMKPAQRNLLLALTLLQESIGKVAVKLPAALSTDSATAVPAVRSIAGEMQAFEAANVVYNRRAAPLILQVLNDNGITGQVIQPSNFLQNLGWLQPSTVAKRIDSQAGRGAGDAATTDPAPGLHGHGLVAVSVGAKTLTPDAANSIPATGQVTFSVKIANQGDNPEQDVRVRVRISGAGDPIRGEEVVDQTQPKTETTVSVKLPKAVPVDQAVKITADVVPVPGEGKKDNNTLTFPAIFRGG
jgi:hypothetical protein